MKFEKTTVDILDYFSTIGSSIHITPLDPQQLFVATEKNNTKNNATIVARARNVQAFEDELPIFNLSNFVSVLKLFSGIDHEAQLKENFVVFKSDDGMFKQFYRLSDPLILSCPKPEKTNVYFDEELDVNFTLAQQTIQRLKTGIKLNTSDSVIIEPVDGKVTLSAVTATTDGKIESGTNSFTVNTGETTSVNFRVGIPASVIEKVAPGDYTVGMNRNFVRFLAGNDEGGKVDLLTPALRFSTFG